MADVVVVNKVDTASEAEMEAALAQVEAANPSAAVIQTACPVTLEDGDSLSGKDALVIEDGPTITHGGMPFGAGMIAARAAGATALDPRPYAAGSLGETFRRYPHIGDVLPAMGYSDEQLRELEQTIAATPCDAVIAGTPIDLARIVESPHPIRQARYEIEHVAGPTLEQALAPAIESARG
jgi:predicted GTPase